ncbi:MAG: hypothetical protein WA175_11720 [Candidatus Acidiferrales bacterium]
MIRTKVATVTVLRNAVAIVAAALLPIAVLGLPVMRTMLLPNGPLFAWLSIASLLRALINLLLPLLVLLILGLSLALLVLLVLVLLPLPLLILLILGLLLPLLALLVLVLLPLPLLVLLALGLLLLLLRGLVLRLLLVLLLRGLGLILLLFRLGLLLLFRGLRVLIVLILLCVHGSDSSKKKEQKSRADSSYWFHVCFLRYGDARRRSLFAWGAFVVFVQRHEAHPPPFIQACLRPNVHAGERMKKSKNVHKPQNRGDYHDRIQDGLDRSLHWYEAVDQPKQNTDHEQNLEYLK